MRRRKCVVSCGLRDISDRDEMELLLLDQSAYRSSTSRNRETCSYCFFFLSLRDFICNSKMASIRLWRRLSLWLWLSCLLLAVYSAPVNEDGTVSEKDNDGGFESAIEAVARAKRDTRKKSSKSGRSLVRYRYPIQVKRSGPEENDEDDYDGDDEARQEELGALLDRNDNAVDLDELAKEMALDILMEEAADKSREQHRSSSLLNKKKKKMAPTAHRPRYSPVLSLDDKRRKRMNSIVNQLLDGQQDEERSGPADNEENEDEEGEEGEEEGENISRTVARALASQGLERSEIDNLLSQLEELGGDNNNNKKKKRSSDWRKWPRASLRWRFLHSQGFDDNELGQHQQDEEEAAAGPQPEDKSIPFQNRFFGRGFHRVGPSIQDEIPSMAAKRVQHPLKTKNAVSVISKRSIVSQKEEAAPRASRKRRSPAADEETGKSKLPNNETTPPLALPVAEPKSLAQQNGSGRNNKSDASEHSGVIRKKSVDWDDYFGYDKRSAGGGDEAMRDYLESDYYKNMAGSLAYRKRGQNHHDIPHGMKKRNNATAWEKKHRDAASLQDAEEALDAALRAVEETGDGDIERVKEQLVAELVENLDEDELEEMTERLSEELARAIREEEEEEDEEDGNFDKRSVKKRGGNKKKKSSSNDDRRKRFAVKRSGRRHPPADVEGKF